MRKIAFYGKGGIGKSTVASHLAAVWGSQDLKIMLIGCDPKADSTRSIVGRRLPSILDYYEEIINQLDLQRSQESLSRFIQIGFGGVKCVEIGGPKPGIGCAGRGISLALELFQEFGIMQKLDVVIFDVLGDVVCGGFAVPMRSRYADEIYIVTSGEFASLFAANNICKSICNMPAKLGGIIANLRGIDDEEEKIREFAQKLNTKLIGLIPKSEVFPQAEIIRKTIIEISPNISESIQFQILSKRIIENKDLSIPTPMNYEEIENWTQDFLIGHVNKAK